jgi:hypothetical protein
MSASAVLTAQGGETRTEVERGRRSRSERRRAWDSGAEPDRIREVRSVQRAARRDDNDLRDLDASVERDLRQLTSRVGRAFETDTRARKG